MRFRGDLQGLRKCQKYKTGLLCFRSIVFLDVKIETLIYFKDFFMCALNFKLKFYIFLYQYVLKPI